MNNKTFTDLTPKMFGENLTDLKEDANQDSHHDEAVDRTQNLRHKKLNFSILQF